MGQDQLVTTSCPLSAVPEGSSDGAAASCHSHSPSRSPPCSATRALFLPEPRSSLPPAGSQRCLPPPCTQPRPQRRQASSQVRPWNPLSQDTAHGRPAAWGPTVGRSPPPSPRALPGPTGQKPGPAGERRLGASGASLRPWLGQNSNTLGLGDEGGSGPRLREGSFGLFVLLRASAFCVS